MVGTTHLTPVGLHTRAYGNSGPTVVILHGLLGSHRNWHSIAQALAPDHRVLTADLRNHGQSPHSPQMDYAHLTADVSALINELDVGRVHLLGHSLGGKVAMCVALAEPDHVESAIIVDIAPVPYPDRNSSIIQALRGLPLSELPTREVANASLATAIPEPAVRQFLLTNLVQTADGFFWQPNLEALADAGPALSGFPDFGPGTAFVGPALFVSGSRSPYRVPDHRGPIHDLFPQARLESIDDAGHWPHAEKPSQFSALLRDFLQANGESAAEKGSGRIATAPAPISQGGSSSSETSV